MVQQLHIHGPRAIKNMEPLILEQSFEDADLTFDERIQLFVEICRKRKSRVQLMLEGGNLERYVLVPGKVLDGSDMNAIANVRRQGDLVKGRETRAAENEDLVPEETEVLHQQQQQEADGEEKLKKRRSSKKGKNAGKCLCLRDLIYTNKSSR